MMNYIMNLNCAVSQYTYDVHVYVYTNIACVATRRTKCYIQFNTYSLKRIANYTVHIHVILSFYSTRGIAMRTGSPLIVSVLIIAREVIVDAGKNLFTGLGS